MPESEDPKNDLRNSQFGGGFINADTDIWNFFFGQQQDHFAQISDLAQSRINPEKTNKRYRKCDSKSRATLKSTKVINFTKKP